MYEAHQQGRHRVEPKPVNAAEQAKGAAVSGRYLVSYREVSPDALAIPRQEVAVAA